MIYKYSFWKALFVLALITGCDAFEFNPNAIVLRDDEKNLNAKNIARLHSKTPGDTIRFVVTGDSQRFLDEADDFVNHINTHQKNIDFVVHTGDISDFGLTKELRWLNDIFSQLQIPYVMVIGNHDMVGNGTKAFLEMYGELDYTFSYGGIGFIGLNTNSREVAFNGSVPNVSWLNHTLQNIGPEIHSIFLFTHVPPFDKDFDSNMEQIFLETLNKSDRFRLSINGHQHRFRPTRQHYPDYPLLFAGISSLEKRSYALVKVWVPTGGDSKNFHLEQILF